MDRWWRDLVFSSKEEYEGFCRRYAQLPEGVRASTVRFGFAPVERPDRQLLMDLSLVVLDEPTVRWAARFTSSAFPGVPVRIGRAMQGRPIQGFVINNRIANVGTAHGEEYALRVRERVGEAVGIDPGLLVPSSTGIIGWELPVERMCEEVEGLVRGVGSADGLALARAIMTTDAYPKLCGVQVGEGMVWGMAKGAGMIEPHLATMLVFLFTDVEVDQDVLDGVLGEVVDRTFNCISVDGDQSTSDSVFLVSTARKGRVEEGVFREALERVCGFLAEQVVRNGEGTGHVVRVEVRGWDDETARGWGRRWSIPRCSRPPLRGAIPMWVGCWQRLGRGWGGGGCGCSRRGCGCGWPTTSCSRRGGFCLIGRRKFCYPRISGPPPWSRRARCSLRTRGSWTCDWNTTKETAGRWCWVPISPWSMSTSMRTTARSGYEEILEHERKAR